MDAQGETTYAETPVCATFPNHRAPDFLQGDGEKSHGVNKLSDKRAFTSQYVMQRHGQHWAELRPEIREAYEQRAAVARALKAAHIKDALEEQEAVLAVAQSSADTVQTCGGMQASNCRLSSASLSRLQQLWDSEIYNESVVKNSHKSAMECPKPLSDSAFSALGAKSRLSCHSAVELCAVAKRVAHARKELAHSVFGIAVDGEWSWFKLALAVLQPLQLVTLPLQELEAGQLQGFATNSQQWRQSQASDFQQAWKYSPGEYEIADIFRDVPLEAIFLTQRTVHQGPGILTTTGSIESLAAFLTAVEAQRPAKTRAKTPSMSQAPPAKKRNLDQVPQWLGVTHGTAPEGAAGGASSSSVSVMHAAVAPSIPEHQELMGEEDVLELEDARASQANTQACIDDSFREHLLGGSIGHQSQYFCGQLFSTISYVQKFRI